MRLTLRHILLAVGFLLLVFAGDRILFAGMVKLIEKSDNRFVRLYSQEVKADVLVLGNSRADRHFPPVEMEKLFGVKVLNLGLGGISTVLSEALMMDYLDHQSVVPKLMIVEVTCLTVDPHSMGDMRLLGVFSKRIEKLAHQILPRHSFFSSIFHLFRLNDEMFARVFFHIFSKERVRTSRKPISRRFLKSLKKRERRKLGLNRLNIEALKRMLAIARERGIPVRLVVTPYLVSLSPGNLESWLKELSQELGKEDHIWDYSSLFSKSEFFADTQHLTARGVSAMLADMKRDHFIP